eukprot:7454732-Pyramimonas_sp.AAC.1
MAPNVIADGRAITGMGVEEEVEVLFRGRREGVRKRQLEEMRFLFAEFCSEHRIRLANTIGPRCATWRGRTAPRCEA